MDDLSGLNDNELRILDILGFKVDGDVKVDEFLKEIIDKKTMFELHDQGISLRSVIAIARKRGLEVTKKKEVLGNQEVEEDLEYFFISMGIS